jgi:hypothetical protein
VKCAQVGKGDLIFGIERISFERPLPRNRAGIILQCANHLESARVSAILLTLELQSTFNGNLPKILWFVDIKDKL